MFTVRLRAAVAVSVGLALLSVVAVAGPASASVNPLAVRSVGFSPTKVDGATSATTSTVTWTVDDADPTATEVSGTLTIRMRGDRPNTYVGRAYNVGYLLGQSGFGLANFVSGTAQESTYSYVFPVPQFAGGHKADWVVTEITATDNTNHSLDDTCLGQFDPVLRSTEQVDSTPPTFSFNPQTLNPYLYANGTNNTVPFSLDIQDPQSGFWKGSITLTGPGGATLTGGLEFRIDPQFGANCSDFGNNVDTQVFCTFLVVVPAGTAAGIWSVSSVSLTDNAGNTKVYPQSNVDPFTVTTNSVVTARNFAMNPSQVNDWTQSATSQLTFDVAGAQGGVSSVQVDASGPAGPNCPVLSTTPTVNGDGSLSVALRVPQGARSCSVNGIAVVDGAGDVSVYGADYGQPDLGLKVSQLPDTVPPTITAASLTPTSIPEANLRTTFITVTATVVAPIAPVDEMEADVFDSNGNVVSGAGAFGGVFENANQQVSLSFTPFVPLAPGTYTVGVSVTDAGGLTTKYGPAGQPTPGGPLTFTVTS